MNERIATHGLLAALLVMGAVAWWFQLRPELEWDGRRLAALPTELGAWIGEDIPLDDAVERLLQADLNLQRVYLPPDENVPVWLYVGYYGTERGGRPEHTPEVCYPAAGWEVVEQRVWNVDGAPGERANEYEVENTGERRLVHFWYQSSRGPGLLGTWDVSVDQLTSRLDDGRADGALVRMSTPIVDVDVAAARERLIGFREVLAGELADRWPEERPVGSGS